MSLFVLSRRDEPNLVVKTVSVAFQEAKIKTLFISNPDQVCARGVWTLPGFFFMFYTAETMPHVCVGESRGVDGRTSHLLS